MNSKKLMGMAMAFVVLSGMAVLPKKGTGRSLSAAGGSERLLAGIDLNAVSALEVIRGTKAVHLIKQNGRWQAADLSGYPVDFKKLAESIRSLAAVKLGPPVRPKNGTAAEFGFDKPPRRVVLKSGETVLAAVEIGARREADGGAGYSRQCFVRKAGDDSVYLVDYDFHPFLVEPEQWIDRQIINVAAAEVVSVRVGALELKLDGAEWTVTGLDAETEELLPSEANRSREALQYINAKTVADKTMSDAALGFDHSVNYVAQTRDGCTYTVTFGDEIDRARYARFAVSYTRLPEPHVPVDAASADQQAAFVPSLETYHKACQATEKKVEDLNAKWVGWTYLISASDAADCLPIRETMVKKKRKEGVSK